MRNKSKIPLLEFKDISILRGDRQILKDISFKIFEGESVAILGPNGAGKSTLIKTIAREYYPETQTKTPTFKIWGKDIWDIFELRATLGIVSSDLQNSFFRRITGRETILSGFFGGIGLHQNNPQITKAMKRKADKIIAFLEAAKLQNQKMTEMSSGEARRFLIGRALIHNPRALLLDEPSNSLDLRALFKMQNLLGKIANSGIGVIIVTHYLTDILPEVKRVILMKDGRFVLDGEKEKVLSEKNLNALFNTKISLKKSNERYFALPKING